jgi:RNA-binding protein
MLTNPQKKYLKKLAHNLSPLIKIGQKGMTDSMIETIDNSLTLHELIKIKFSEFKEEKKELSEKVVEKTGCGLVGIIGNIAILYRQAPDPKNQQIRLPKE